MTDKINPSCWAPIGNLTANDIGRRVAFTGNKYPGGVWEYGFIKSFNSTSVFVVLEGKRHPQATSRTDLVWIAL